MQYLTLIIILHLRKGSMQQVLVTIIICNIDTNRNNNELFIKSDN